MRRLIVEFSIRAFSKLIPERPKQKLIQKIRSLEVLHFLRLDYKEAAMILRVEFNEPNVSIEDIFPGDLTEIQLLEHERGRGEEKESEVNTYFIKAFRSGSDLTATSGYVLTIRDARWKGKDDVSWKRQAGKRYY